MWKCGVLQLYNSDVFYWGRCEIIIYNECKHFVTLERSFISIFIWFAICVFGVLDWIDGFIQV